VRRVRAEQLCRAFRHVAQHAADVAVVEEDAADLVQRLEARDPLAEGPAHAIPAPEHRGPGEGEQADRDQVDGGVIQGSARRFMAS
jgi:hypothetical protein